MRTGVGSVDREPAHFDAIAEDLQRLRVQTGDVSYADIAVRIAEYRQSAGLDEAAARVSRSTVYDAFRLGRRRMNPDFVAEIVIALGASPEEAEDWRNRCVAIRLAATQRSAPAPLTAASVTSAPAIQEPKADSIASNSQQPPSLRTAFIIVLLIGCVGINIFGNTVADKFDLTLFLDMVGTAIAAIALGLWYGALVGITTNAFAAVSGSPASLIFSLVNITGALVWGYGYHRFGLGKSVPRFLLLNLLAALACTLVAVPITVILFGGVVTHASFSITQALVALGQGIWVATLSANFLSSILDKFIAGYIAFAAAKLLRPLRLRRDGYGTQSPT